MSITEKEYSIAEVARHLRVSEPTLRHAIKLERLPIIRRAGRIKITPEGIDQFLRQRQGLALMNRDRQDPLSTDR